MITGQATLNSATPTAICTLVDKRDILTINSTADCFVGGAAVTALTGLLVKAGIPLYLSCGDPAYAATAGTLYGITATGAATVSFLDMANQ